MKNEYTIIHQLFLCPCLHAVPQLCILPQPAASGGYRTHGHHTWIDITINVVYPLNILTSIKTQTQDKRRISRYSVFIQGVLINSTENPSIHTHITLCDPDYTLPETSSGICQSEPTTEGVNQGCPLICGSLSQPLCPV